MTDNTFRIKYGEKFPINITLKNQSEDTPIDLTGAIIRWRIKDELKDTEYLVEKEITETSDENTVGKISSPTEGKLFARLTDDDYNKLIIDRVYYLVITWEIPDENFVKVISASCNNNLKFIVCAP